MVLLTKHNGGHVARIGELPGRTGPLRVLTRTFLKVSFLLEPAAFTPTWIRPLVSTPYFKYDIKFDFHDLQYNIFGGIGFSVKFSLCINFSIFIIYYSKILLF